jgi:hypothetical protein
MTTGKFLHYNPVGRIRGCCIYTLICCPDNDRIFLKFGMSATPEKRIQHLIVGCPFETEVLAYIELQNRTTARNAEKAVHDRLAAWNTRGEWFCFTLNDKPEFNRLLKEALTPFHNAAWPIKWTKFSVSSLIDRHLSKAQKNLIIQQKRLRRF